METTISPSLPEQASRLQISAGVGDYATLMGVLDALAVEPFLAGDEPFGHTIRLTRVKPDAMLLPPGVEAIRTVTDTKSVSRLAHGDGWTLCSWRGGEATACITVTARTEELAKDIATRAAEGATEPEPPDDVAVVMGFWHLGGHSARRYTRTIVTPAWSDIRRNYTGPVAEAFDHLFRLGPDELTGRLVLLHGPPGTGKTTALRTIARAWRSWCDVECVIDPEHMISHTSYLLDMMVFDSDDKRWRMLVLEDCDELLRHDAKAGTGQGLSRLLNVTDGLLGDGSNVLLCISTNEDLHRLHPAIVRPGRCLARIYVDRLTRAEAIEWLGADDGIPANGATLAELYARRGDLATVERDEPQASAGLYL